MGKQARCARVSPLVICLLLGSSPAWPENWRANIYDGVSGHLVGVDKKNHTFNFFEKKSPLRLRYTYPCVTGQVAGDKWQINDLRTPEGIYFVEYKIANGLDFKEYGGIAYTLNYPNPVDRLRGKTGHGIWIHSKGYELVPTKGCVAIDLKNIAEVGPMLTPGTPVVLAEELNGLTRDNGELETLRGLMRDWSNTWAARSDKLFDYYDQDAYTRATENFGAFRQNKERLFKILSFIKIYNREIHALEGPGYWVTWSEQFYTASNLSTEGVRRLYWQRGDDGHFKIVGMEWIPRDLGMRADFQKGRLVAEGPVTTLADASSEAPTAPRLDMPEAGGEENQPPASNEEANTKKEESAKMVAVSEPLVSKKQTPGTQPDEIVWGIGKKLGDSEVVATPEKESAPRENVPVNRDESNAPLPTTVDNATEPAPATPPQPVKKTVDMTTMPSAETVREVAKSVDEWNIRYAKRMPEIEDLYDRDHFNHLPQSAGVPKGPGLNATLKAIKKDFGKAWLVFINRQPQMETIGPFIVSSTDQMLVGPDGARQGVQKLWWGKSDSGYKIVGAEFKPAPLGLEANYLEYVSGAISTMLESWRQAWEKGSLDAYMEFYTPDARQQGRMGNRNIRRQKEQLWSRVWPKSVRMNGLRLAIDPRGIRADMTQIFENSAGHTDKGTKTLLLRYDGGKWRIQREEWVNSQQAHLDPARQRNN